MVDVRTSGRGRGRALALVVAGVGNDDSLAYSGGVAFCSANVPAQGTGDYYWLGLATDTPSNVGATVDPYTVTMSGSSFVFQIAHNVVTALLLLDTQRRSLMSLLSLVTAGATTVFLTGTGSTALAGTVVWMGGEAILLGTHAGSGRYDNCTRGYWSTTGESHKPGALAFTRNRYLKHRKCYLVEYDGGGTARVVDRGFVTSEPSTDRAGMRIQVSADSLINMFSGGMINQGCRSTVIEGGIIPDESSVMGPQLHAADFSFTDRVTSDTTSASVVWFGVAGTIAYANAQDDAGTIAFSGRLLFADAPDLDVDDEQTRLSDGDAKQLFVVVRSLLGGANALASSSGLGDAYNNPAALAYGFCIGGDWGDAWSAGMDSEMFNASNIADVIADTTELAIDQIVLGWDGQAVSIEELVLNWLMRASGLFVGIDDDGRLNFHKLGPLTIEDFANASPIDILPGVLQRIPRADSGYNSISVEIGGLPWNDPDPLVVSNADALETVEKRSFLSRKRELTYDMRTTRKGKSELLLQSNLINKVIGGVDNADRVRVEVMDSAVTGVDLSIGAFVRINPPALNRMWWVQDGVAIEVDPDNPTFTGQIMARQRDYDTGVVSIDLLMLSGDSGKFTRWRAPSGVVTAYDGPGGTVTIAVNDFHDTGADIDMFEGGDYIDIYWADGEQKTTDVMLVTQVLAGNVIELATGFSTAAIAGDIVRLATFPGYGIGGEPVTGAGRAYVFAADEGTRMLDGTNTDADVYG